MTNGLSSSTHRRDFLKTAGAAAGLLFTGCAAGRRRAGDERLRLGVIGVGNRGAENLAEVASEQIVALADVDAGYLAAAAERHPQARTFRDFSELLADCELDAVVISTPDHTHFPVAKAALDAGLDVYCEKPLAHSVHEVVELMRLARAKRAVTQMGIQIHARENYHRVVEIVRAGTLGRIREVHVFCSKRWAGAGRPAGTYAVPESLDWNLWLGDAERVAYHPAYHPAGWRGYWPFGCGTLGDMACHTMDLPHWALGLGRPRAVHAKGPPVDPFSTPSWLIVDYEHDAPDGGEPIRLSWYDGGTRPSLLAPLGLDDWQDGVLFVGDAGHLVADYDRHVLGPEERFRGFAPPPRSLPQSIGHHKEWIEAVKSRGATTCGFDYAGPLTQAVLLGNVAYRAGRRLVLARDRLGFENAPEAEALL